MGDNVSAYFPDCSLCVQSCLKKKKYAKKPNEHLNIKKSASLSTKMCLTKMSHSEFVQPMQYCGKKKTITNTIYNMVLQKMNEMYDI